MINKTLLFLPPFFMSWTQRSKTFSMYTKGLFLLNIVYKVSTLLLQVHFIDGILNAQRYRAEILRSIVVPFIHDHHLMLQHDNARSHIARICTQFLEAESIPVLAWPAYSLDMSPIEHVWDALDRRIRAACSSSCQYPATSHTHWRGVDQQSTGHNQQPDQLDAKEMCCTAWGKWWSHQVLTGFRTNQSPPPPHTHTFYSVILLWPA